MGAPACRPSAEIPAAPPVEVQPVERPSPIVAPSASAVTKPAEPATEPTTLIADPEVLSRLESDGFDAGTAVVGVAASSTAELAKSPAYRTLRDAVALDLAADRRSDPLAGVGMRFAHRQFDVRWLESPKVRFVLAGVVNRLDRAVFAPDYCGEVRFVYRLAYATETPAGRVESRLPMTMNVVAYLSKRGPDACRDLARSWLAPKGPHDTARQLAWLVADGGPLSAARRAGFVPKSVELNFQSVRWPSTVRPSMAGHAE